MHSGVGAAPEGDTTVYVGLTETHVDRTVYVGLSADIGQQQEAAEINKAMEPGLDPKQEPEFHI